MRSSLLVFLTLTAAAPIAFGQTPATPVIPAAPAVQAPQVEMIPAPAWLAPDLACSPMMTTQPPSKLRIIGSQDTVIKYMLGPGDTLLVNGGSAAGLQPGQQFLVRRLVRGFGEKGPDALHPMGVHTAAWIEIVAVDTSIATATVLHPCEGIMVDDYLDPFTPPMIAARAVPGTSPQYANMGRILTADQGFQDVGAPGQFINIDRGSDMGVVPGQRYLVFRDKRGMRNASPEFSLMYMENTTKLPLVEIGELLVVSVRPTESTAQVVRAKDTLTTGDFIAEIR